MSNHSCILLQTSEGWQLASFATQQPVWSRVQGGLEVGPHDLAEAVDRFISQSSLSRRVLIALASHTTLAMSFEANDSSELRHRRRLSYRLEESIPVAAEDFVADFLVDGTNVCGVAVDPEGLLPIVTALDERDVHVQSIVPMALQALQSLLETGGIREHDPQTFNLIAWQNGSQLEIFRLEQRLNDWFHLPADAGSLVSWVGAQWLRCSDPLRVLLIDCDLGLQESLQRLDGLKVQSIESVSMMAFAFQGAWATASGKRRPWIELLRGELTMGDPHRSTRGARNLCWAAAALLILAMTIFGAVRSYQYQRQARSSQQRQVAMFQETFPNSRVPTAVVSRLTSEYRKLLGARGEEAAVRLPPSALNVLYKLVAGLPPDLRLQVEQIRIENGQIDLDVKVRSVGAAGQVADAIQNHGFVVEPPTTEQRGTDTVLATIRGDLLPNAKN